MAPANFNYDTEVLPVVRTWAAKRFARHHDMETMLLDAESYAWEFHHASPASPPKAIAWYAIKRVASGQRCQRSTRSIDGPNPRKRHKPKRDTIVVLDELSRPGDDPADIAAFRCDFPEWVKSLTKQKRAIADALAQGDRTGTLATRFGCSAGRISQIRQELAASWEAFTA
jgi:hypothetical protein